MNKKEIQDQITSIAQQGAFEGCNVEYIEHEAEKLVEKIIADDQRFQLASSLMLNLLSKKGDDPITTMTIKYLAELSRKAADALIEELNGETSIHKRIKEMGTQDKNEDSNRKLDVTDYFK